MLSNQTTIKKSRTKAFNLSLDENAVKQARKNLAKQGSFSQYLSNLIKQDLTKQEQSKKFSDIFGKDFVPIVFNNITEEKEYYDLIGLKDYELKLKD